MIHVALLLGCAVILYLACEWFVNAVEWLGLQLKVGPVAVGTILAAVGTALPESVVTLVAVTGSGAHGADIGVGAALGGPLVVATVAYATVGATLLARRWTALRAARAGSVARPAGSPDSAGPAARPAGSAEVEPPIGTCSASEVAGPGPVVLTGVLPEAASKRLARDQTWFLVIFVLKVGLGLVAFVWKPWLGLLFFAAYAVYFWRELRGGGEAAADELEPLKLQPRREVPSRLAVLTQTAVTLVVIFVASQVFVGQLEWAGPAMGLPPVVVALLLSPIATELPETMNALIWVRQGKTHLALANISGAMMIQATIPSGIGLVFTPWMFDTPLMLAGAATLAAVIYLRVLLRAGRLTAGRLAGAAAFYAAFAVALGVVL
jgi:cation:H+ antiporter